MQIDIKKSKKNEKCVNASRKPTFKSNFETRTESTQHDTRHQTDHRNVIGNQKMFGNIFVTQCKNSM